MKSLLGAGRQLAVTRQVEALMEGKLEDTDCLMLDPKGSKGEVARRPTPYQSAMVFMIGGGTYLEHISLMVRYMKLLTTIVSKGLHVMRNQFAELLYLRC